MQAQDMTREKQINFRVSDEEAERFDRVAAHHGIAVAAMIRMLVKREEMAIGIHAPKLPSLRDEHALLLHIITDRAKQPDWEPLRREDMNFWHGQPSEIDCLGAMYPDARWTGGLNRVLRELREMGYLQRTPNGGYAPTGKAIAWSTPPEKDNA